MTTYYDGITLLELKTLWKDYASRHYDTFEEFKTDYIKRRKRARQARLESTYK